jgi:hypothetical protein
MTLKTTSLPESSGVVRFRGGSHAGEDSCVLRIVGKHVDPRTAKFYATNAADLARSENWEKCLFHTVAEAIEFTALQRGIERWQPPSFTWPS